MVKKKKKKQKRKKKLSTKDYEKLQKAISKYNSSNEESGNNSGYVSLVL